MEFTKQQRHEIYKKALEYHLSDIPPYAMCYRIRYAIARLYPQINIHTVDILDYLPEFAELKPKSLTTLDYWWDENDKDIRTQYFKQLIEETK